VYSIPFCVVFIFEFIEPAQMDNLFVCYNYNLERK
jgi:hypothetical protein